MRPDKHVISNLKPCVALISVRGALRIILTFAVTVVVAACATSPQKIPADQDTFSKQTLYLPTEVSAIRAESTRIKGSNVKPVGAHQIILVPPERYRLQVRFEGKSKVLSEETRDFVGYAARSFPDVPQQQWNAYTEEILVSAEGEPAFWMPVQGAVTTTLIPELTIGENFEVFVFWFGEYDSRLMLFANAANSFD